MVASSFFSLSLSPERIYGKWVFSLNSIVTASYFIGLSTFQFILFSRQMSRIYHLKRPLILFFFMFIVVQSEHPIVNADNKWVNTTTKIQLAAIDEFSFVGENYEKKVYYACLVGFCARALNYCILFSWTYFFCYEHAAI